MRRFYLNTILTLQKLSFTGGYSAPFYALKDDTLIKRIMSIRAMDTDNIKMMKSEIFGEDLKQKFSLDKNPLKSPSLKAYSFLGRGIRIYMKKLRKSGKKGKRGGRI